MSRFEAVIFDYGGVISTPPFAGLGPFERERGYPDGSVIRLLFGGERDQAVPGGTAAAMTAVLAAYDAIPVAGMADWHLLETGRITLSEYGKRLAARAEASIGVALAVEEIFEFVLGTVVLGVNWEYVHRARRLRADGYKTAICTNNLAEWRPIWQGTVPLDAYDEVVDSSDVGLRKPDAAMFALVCERLGVAPGRAVFLDDSPGHVAGARAAGLAGVVVADPAQGLRDLERLLA